MLRWKVFFLQRTRTSNTNTDFLVLLALDVTNRAKNDKSRWNTNSQCKVKFPHGADKTRSDSKIYRKNWLSTVFFEHVLYVKMEHIFLLLQHVPCTRLSHCNFASSAHVGSFNIYQYVNYRTYREFYTSTLLRNPTFEHIHKNINFI